MARGTFICATAVALQGVASSGRTCEILFIAGRRRRRKKREGERGCERERERREGKRNDKNRGKERGREGSGREKKKKGSLPLDCNGREARFIALSRRCRCTHGDPSCAIPRIGFQEDGLYEGAIRDILYYGGRGRERGQ